MKKKLIMLVMASTMVLAACGSKDVAATTAAVEATTEATSDEATTEEATTEEATETEETESDAAETEAADATEVDLSAALADMDMKTALEMTGITLAEDGDKYLLTYPAAMFAGLSEEDIEAAIAEDSEGVVTLNEDGSVVLELTQEQYDMMEEEFNTTMNSMAQ